MAAAAKQLVGINCNRCLTLCRQQFFLNLVVTIFLLVVLVGYIVVADFVVASLS